VNPEGTEQPRLSYLPIAESSKSQAPNLKQEPNLKKTNSKQEAAIVLVLGFSSFRMSRRLTPDCSPGLEFAVLPFGPCLMFGACDLELTWPF
jgi:hypothetical protein